MSKQEYIDDNEFIIGKSYILKNTKVITDLNIIKNNNLTILNLLSASKNKKLEQKVPRRVPQINNYSI